MRSRSGEGQFRGSGDGEGRWPVNGVVKKDPSKPTDPYQKVLEMQPGEITDAISYKNAYYVLRRGDSVPKTFENAKPELLVSIAQPAWLHGRAENCTEGQDRLKGDQRSAKGRAGIRR